ncbi:MAG: ABC transporter permease [Planctomycetota bacterium]|nr:ABC transporter permease [Planctomycetota bacterium]
MSAAAPQPMQAGESQWAIAARQFSKRATAVWGLWGVRVLFYLAVFAPVICSGLPFLWREPGGALEMPWFSKIFDRLYWQNGVDRFFNLLMFTTVAWWIARLLIRLIVTEAKPRARMRTRALGIYGAVVAVLAILQGFGTAGLVTSQPYIDYHEQSARMEKEVEALRAQLAATPSPELEARLRTYDDRVAVFAIVPFGHREQSPRGTVDRFRGPLERSSRGFHVLGTSLTGNDVLAQLLYGTRISLTVGILAVAIYVTIGLIVGGIAGFFGGMADMLIMRVIEIVLAVPGLFLILTIIALFDNRSIFMIMIAIGIVGWTGIARLVRGEFIRERSKDYVGAARSLGLSSGRILFRHVMPNAIAPVIVSATFGVASAIITESTLSFLGLGDTSVPSWGQMLDMGRQNSEWHMIAVPGVAIFITVTLLNLVGDGLRDAMDPKLRR